MSLQDQAQSSNEVNNNSTLESVSNATPTPSSTPPSSENPNDSIIDWIIGSATDVEVDADASPPQSSTSPRIPRVPGTFREKHDYKKYFVPQFVSIGPYHFGDSKLQAVEKRKPRMALKLFSNNKEALTSLYERLSEPEMVKDLRSFYEENSTTTEYCDKVFTKMMLLDSCFILYFIEFLYGGGVEDDSELKNNEVFFVRRDLYLLENQIPFKVLKEVMRFWDIDWVEYITPFIDMSSFVWRMMRKTKWLDNFRKTCSNGGDEDDEEPNHLLGALHGKHTRIVVKASTGTSYPSNFDGHHNFRNVSELADVGIYFKPIKDTLSMANIEYVRGWWGFSANVKLPPIAVSDYSRPMLLNMMAYEMCCCPLEDSWVRAYVCFLDSLIDNAEDVKILRRSWVLKNYLASDQEVVKLFDEIGTDLIENNIGYVEAKYKIQRHYESRSNTVFSQLKKEYFKSPWAFIALLGALIALFLTGVQAYFTVWSPKTSCDDLCVFLKMNHRL